MPIITLTTDMGLKDYYVAVLKGAILRQLPDAGIIDISHSISPFNLKEAAFVVKNAYGEFPPGSIHILGINPDADEDTAHVAILYDGHYFIGADNGIFSMIFEREPEKIIELDISQDTDYLTFPTKDIFVTAACHLARGGTLEVIGKKRNALERRIMFNPITEENHTIKGMIIYIDSYYNVITNIRHDFFKDFSKGRKFNICFRMSEYNIDRISKNYTDVPESEMLALFGSTGFLEIAINRGEAAKLLGLKTDDIVRIEFT